MPQTNTGQAVKAIAADIVATLAKARKASADSLADFRRIGVRLVEAKEILPSGEYLLWAADEFGFSKQWCARLTSLHKNWTKYEQARAWAENQGHGLGSNAYSVDGALALIQRWQKAISPEPEGGKDKPKKQTPTQMRVELEKLRTDLSALTDENEWLKAELARLSGQGSSAHGDSQSDASARHGTHLGEIESGEDQGVAASMTNP
jgi:hypothetical protein